MLHQLFKPFDYLRIIHDDKRKVDWLYPITVALLAVITFEHYLPSDYLTKNGGLASLTLGFIQSLPGFYIAALAAVATFGKKSIDRYFPTPMPFIYKRNLGENTKTFLTRRTFLCMLFAFLTCESIILVLFSIILILLPNETQHLAIKGFNISYATGLLAKFSYLLLLSQMLIATFWGLFYLGYKIHE